jgi:cell division septation protein DedD
MGELAQAWHSGDRAAAAPVEPEPEEGRWGLTLVAVLLCLVLGGAAFWYWRANQQIPEGEFTFVETSGAPGADAQAARSAEEPAAPASGEGVPTAEIDAVAAEEAPADVPVEEAPPEDAPAPAPVNGGATPPTASAATAEERPAADPAAASPATTEGAELAPPREGAPLPFSLHVGSYQTFEAARRAASGLERSGQPAFVAPVLLEGKGQWYRVFLGALPDGASARAELERALAEGLVVEGTVRETPWALHLGSHPTPEAADEELARLARSGVSAYALGDGPVHLYAGAFETAGDAELLNRELRDRGFEAALVRRRATEAR